MSWWADILTTEIWQRATTELRKEPQRICTDCTAEAQQDLPLLLCHSVRGGWSGASCSVWTFFFFNWELPSCLLDLTTVISVAGFWLLMMGGFFRVGLSHRFCPHHLCCSVKITSSCTVPLTEIFQSDGWASQLSRTWWEIYHLHAVHVAALAWPLKVGIWMPQSWMLSSGRMLPTEHFKGFVYSSIFMLVPWI